MPDARANSVLRLRRPSSCPVSLYIAQSHSIDMPAKKFGGVCEEMGVVKARLWRISGPRPKHRAKILSGGFQASGPLVKLRRHVSYSMLRDPNCEIAVS